MIVHIIFSLAIGGSEHLVADIVNQQCLQRRVMLIIINNIKNKQIIRRIDKRVKVVCLERKPADKRHFRFLLHLWYLLIKNKPTTIHCHNANLAKLIYPWRKRACLTLHAAGLPLQEVKYFSKVFAISRSVQTDVQQRGGFLSHVIYNGIHINNIVRRTCYYCQAGDVFYIVQVGRLLREEKGQHISIAAMHLLTERYGLTNMRLVFIGEGPSQQDLAQMTAQYALEPYIYFAGARERTYIYRHLWRYHVLIQPSLREGFGLTIIEALAAGIPAIVSNLDGPAELTRFLGIGKSVVPDSAEDLAAKIYEVYTDYLHSNVQGNREYIPGTAALDCFDIKRTASYYLTAYGAM